jgi:hypothetical protein
MMQRSEDFSDNPTVSIFQDCRVKSIIDHAWCLDITVNHKSRWREIYPAKPSQHLGQWLEDNGAVLKQIIPAEPAFMETSYRYDLVFASSKDAVLFKLHWL